MLIWNDFRQLKTEMSENANHQRDTDSSTTFSSDDECMYNENSITLPGEGKRFRGRNVDQGYDYRLISEIGNHLVSANRSIDIKSEYLTWRGSALVPKSNEHAIRYLVKVFRQYVPREIQFERLPNNMLLILHKSVIRFQFYKHMVARLDHEVNDNYEDWNIDVSFRTPQSRKRRRNTKNSN